ncbi:hypothetical protein SERN_0445 [Serinibacter arcticus]|uniref:Uncharacterized protein n=1 Tax=Serinibacter arcticus TaxID=1655435 RepID=A0A4Z1E706_9MICO|nr:hypothetical protein SERN_0445 [Serinibacter arcticus]
MPAGGQGVVESVHHRFVADVVHELTDVAEDRNTHGPDPTVRKS